jgi:hypothetical protein
MESLKTKKTKKNQPQNKGRDRECLNMWHNKNKKINKIIKIPYLLSSSLQPPLACSGSSGRTICGS